MQAMRRNRRWLVGAISLAFVGVCSGQTIPADWLRAAPGAREVAAIQAGMERYGREAMARALRDAALQTYARGGASPVADAWRNAARWAQHESLPGAWLWADAELSAAYLEREQAGDDRAKAMRILETLREKHAADFHAYESLAVAIALVYDQPPPSREWPHWQVTESALPRKLPAPEETFAFFVEWDRGGRSLHRLTELDAAELRFLVDLAAPMSELSWARERFARTPLSRLDETYSAVAYRMERIAAEIYVWPGKRYTLDDILAEGGICVDQAYVATQAGKARGVPTLFFAGAGRDGRHAWFGYLGPGRKWRLDAGRYAEQEFVTGLALDPQTWEEISDHELMFLSEGFRREKPAREAAIHAGFARWLLEDGRGVEAEAAARAAVRLERRELRGWDVLVDLQPQPGAAREAVAREAAASLSSYPELNARYLGLVIESLAKRGEAAEAERLGREMVRRFAGRRGDLSTAQIAAQLKQAAATQSVAEQLKVYRSNLRRFGRGAGAAMWDDVARPFVVGLAQQGKFTEAREALLIARDVLVVSGGSQLETEINAMAAQLALAERGSAKRDDAR
jgi:hypothetical protein